MKKVPNIYRRTESKELLVGEWNPLCLWVRDGEGIATRKWDGAACMVRGGVLFKRYDAKWAKGTKEYKTPPSGWEPCQDPDPITGHWPGWVPCRLEAPEDRWFWEGFDGQPYDHEPPHTDGTYELCGPKVGGNPEDIARHVLIPHGKDLVSMCSLVPGTDLDDVIRELLTETVMEGVVFHHAGGDGRMAKIRRGDLGLPWPVKAVQQ